VGGCNTDSCLRIKSFVESLAINTSEVSVFEEANDLNVYVRHWRAGKTRTLTLQGAQAEPLDEPMKRKIREFLAG